MRAAFAILLIAAAALSAARAQTTQCHFDCYNFKGPVSDGQALKSSAVAACTANGVAGKPAFSSGSTYFQTHANTAPEEGCTFSACTPFSGTGYSSAYSTCEHATSYWKALTATANTTSTAARANANVPCTACPSA